MKKLKMTNETYDTIRAIAEFWLPASATMVTAIMVALNIPGGEVVGAIALAVDTFLGGIVKYYKYQFDKDNQTEAVEDDAQ